MNIAFVPVRAGSKSIPNKNFKPFCGKPLFYWVLKAAQDCREVDELVLATDSDEMEQMAHSFQFSKLRIYRRESVNATDTATTESVILEYLSRHQERYHSKDRFILLQATSPFTTAKDIHSSLKLIEEGFDSVLSVVPFKRFLWTEGKALNYEHRRRPRRQDMTPSYLENGAIYIQSIEGVLRNENRLGGRIGLYEMEEFTQVEIDEPQDWKLAEFLFREHIASKLFPLNTTHIKLVLTDVDGVLTDAGMYYSENGDELKKFNTRDGMAFELLRQAGIKSGIITSENTALVERRAQKLKADYLIQGKRDGGKLSAAKEICKKEGIELNEVAYIGDDINCKELLKEVGFAACPIDASLEVRQIVPISILSKSGGNGVFREFVEILLKKRYE